MVTPLAAKKQRVARRQAAKSVMSFYLRSFPGSMEAPAVFWEFIHDEEAKLERALEQAGENQSRINAACRRFVDLFKKACVRARMLTDAESTGNEDASGGAITRGEAARQALEVPERPSYYRLW